MSYEGINHRLCVNGHYDSGDALTEMYEMDTPAVCLDCGAAWYAVFAQDYTNGSDPDYPYSMPPVLEPDLIKNTGQTCNLGHFHPDRSPVYLLPTFPNSQWRKL